MKNVVLVFSAVVGLFLSACGGGDDGSNAEPRFRLLQLGDRWTFTQATTFTAPGIGPLNYVHQHTVTVVENVADASGQIHPGLAFRSDYTQTSGPDAPVGAEFELFSQDTATRDVSLRGNITPSGQFLAKSGTIYLGTYDEGKTVSYDGDVNDQIITFIGTVIGQEDVGALGQTLECWLVDLVEVSEPNGQDFHSNGTQTQKVYPALGSRVESAIEFDIGAPFFGRFEVTSTITSTNVSF